MRKTLLLITLAATGYAQTFEVASIRPAAQMTPELIMAGKMNIGMKVDAARASFGYLTLRDLLAIAYDVKPFQISGPDALAAQRWDIAATLPEGATKEQVPAMLRQLLEDRFKLKAHKDKKEQNVYALEVAKGGHKMKDAPAATPPPEEPPKADMVVGANGDQIRINRVSGGQNGQGAVTMSGGRNGTTKMSMQNGMMHMEMERFTMAELVGTLTPMLDRPVVDHTALTGAYQIALDLSMADMMAAARAAGVGANLPPQAGAAAGALAASDPSGGSIFNSIQQLGLRLEKEKSAVDTVVVESFEKEPTEN